MAKKVKFHGGFALPENYSDSLHFLHRMFSSQHSTDNTVRDSNSKVVKGKKVVVYDVITTSNKKRNNTLSKIQNVKSPLSKLTIFLFVIALIVMTTVLSVVFINVGSSSDNSQASNAQAEQAILDDISDIIYYNLDLKPKLL